jgi:hypothetical protein
MSQYLLILKENPADFTGFSPEELQKMFGEYKAWRTKLQADGNYVGGNKLAEEGGKIMARNGSGIRVTDGPYVEAKEVIGGYFLISAANYDEAVKIAESCPHLKFNGHIELREVEQTS